MKLKNRRIGPRMKQVAEIVGAAPGSKLYDVALAVAPTGVPGGRPGLGYGYKACWRAVGAGLVEARERDDKRGCYRLFPVEG